jgi:hypothetical protein
MTSPGSPNNFFAFGPSQSFVAWDFVYSTSSNLSNELSTLLAAENVKNLNFVVLLGGPNGGNATTITQAYIGYHKKHGLKTSGLLYSPSVSTAKSDTLEEWIKNQDKKTEGVQVVYNGKGGFWARVERDGKPKVFDENLSIETKQWLKKTNPHGAFPTCVALGIKDSYVIVYEDEHVTWDLKGCYETLDKILSQTLATNTKLLYLSLNPYHEDEYFCHFVGGSCTYRFPDTEEFRNLDNLFKQSDLQVIIESPTLKHSTDPVVVPDSKPKDTAKAKDGAVKTVVEKAAEAAAEKELEEFLENL